MAERIRAAGGSALARPTDIGDDPPPWWRFLASDDGEYVNGQVIAVDGGATMR